MNSLQEQFDNRAGGEFTLPPGEYEGPLRVLCPCTIDGGGATLWARQGPVLTVAAAGVTVKNLRVEVTESASGPAAAALTTEHADTVLEQVEVRGDVVGVPREAPHWELPSLLSLGDFAAGVENSFALRLTVPAGAELVCGLGGVTLSPGRLAVGEQTVLLQVDALRDRTILYGEIFVKTKVLRRICVTGRAMKDAPQRRETAPTSPAAEGPVPVPEALIAPAAEGESVPYVKRGQRVAFQELGQSPRMLKAALEYQGLRQPLELDAYVFLLQGNNRVRGDADFVFFGNPASQDGAVRLAESGSVPLVLADLEKLDPAVERVAICYSIYEDQKKGGQTFAQVQDPLFRVFAGEQEVFRLKLEDLRVEKTLVAAEVYRYKGQWKLNFVGAGYRDGLRRLCESYGIEVE